MCLAGTSFIGKLDTIFPEGGKNKGLRAILGIFVSELNYLKNEEENNA